MADPIQRVNYFRNQFLHVEDFTTEQAYNIEARRRHNRTMHTFGVADGLRLAFTPGGTAVTIRPGTAIDNQGREIVLVEDETKELAEYADGADAYVTIAYDEVATRERDETGVSGHTRVEERPRIETFRTKPAEGARVLLGRVTRGGTSKREVTGVDESERSQAGAIEGDVLLTPRDPAIPAGDWVPLRWTGAKQADLTGSLRVRKGAPTTPDGNLAVDGSLGVDQAGRNLGDLASGGLTFGAPGTAEGITSKRTAGGNQYGLDLFTRGASRLSITNAGNVGIGTAQPVRRLHVEGSEIHSGGGGSGYSFGERGVAGISDDPAQRWVLYAQGGAARLWSSGFGDRLVVAGSTGRVGIGTPAPAQLLDVVGGTASIRRGWGNFLELWKSDVNPPVGWFVHSPQEPRTDLVFGFTQGAATSWERLTLRQNGISAVNTFIGEVGHGDGWAGFAHRDSVGNDRYALVQSNDGLNTFLNKRAGGGTIAFRVGNVDRLRMDEHGTLSIDVAGTNQGASIHPAQGAAGTALVFGGLTSGEGIGSKRTPGGNTVGLDFYSNYVPRMSITNGGSVGIGTVAPEARLHVAGGDIRWAQGVLTADQAGSLELGGRNGVAGGGTPYVDFHFGSLVQDFNARLINDADSRLSVEARTLRNNMLCLSGAPGWSSISYNAHHNPANNNWTAIDPNSRSVTIEMDDLRGTAARFEVWLTQAPGLTFVRRLAINGNNGVITLDGQLHVNAGKNAYVMDQFVNNLDDAVEQGDVVVFAGAAPSHYYGTHDQIPIPEVDLTDQPYDRRVCGIVEAAQGSVRGAGPGAGDEDTGEAAQVELFDGTEGDDLDKTRVEPGQVGTFVTLGAYAFCKVDADVAPIEVGDLLTTSPTKGHAQKVVEPERANGAVVGKAMAPLAEGKGKIPVFVTLH